MQGNLYTLLAKGDRRTVNNVDKAVEILKTKPALVSEVLAMMRGESQAVAMRASDCLEKFSRKNAQQLEMHRDALMDILENASQKEVRWHLAQILPRVQLPADCSSVASKIWLYDFYNSPSSIVRTESLQALFNIRNDYPSIGSELRAAVAHGLDSEFPGVRARAMSLSRDL